MKTERGWRGVSAYFALLVALVAGRTIGAAEIVFDADEFMGIRVW